MCITQSIASRKSLLNVHERKRFAVSPCSLPEIYPDIDGILIRLGVIYTKEDMNGIVKLKPWKFKKKKKKTIGKNYKVMKSERII